MHFEDFQSRRLEPIGEPQPLQMGQPMKAAPQSEQSEYLMVGKTDGAHVPLEPQFSDTNYGEFQAMG